MITIDQLLESVDLDFEPRWITKDMDGTINVWENKPLYMDDYYGYTDGGLSDFGKLRIAEFDGKDWTECIYEVPRKTTGNEIEQKMLAELERKINAIVDAAIDAVNELKGAKNE